MHANACPQGIPKHVAVTGISTSCPRRHTMPPAKKVAAAGAVAPAKKAKGRPKAEPAKEPIVPVGPAGDSVNANVWNMHRENVELVYKHHVF